MDIFQNVAVVLRTYNNNADTVKSVSRALKNGAGLVIVVVNASDEATRGNVRAWLAGLKQANERRLVIIEMNEGYSWCNALNVAFAHIRQHNRCAHIRSEQVIDFVVGCSNEVLWERSHLEAMLVEANTSSCIGVVGTSFEGRENGNVVDLGTSYVHPRNTFMLIRWEAFLAVGHFDAVCDGLGGMEDLHFIMNMMLCGNFVWKHLDLNIRLIVGKNHNQGVKEARELDAMRKMVKYFRDVVDGISELVERVESTLLFFKISGL